MHNITKLVLEDGTSFKGLSFGFEHSISGEVVFNTGMVGYPETFTDPSYKGQILVLTYPLIGNYGVPSEEIKNNLSKNFESDKIQISGLIISDYSVNHSHWNSVRNLSEWLYENKIPALYGVDTRALTKRLREKGSSLGKIVFDKDDKDPGFFNPNKVNLSETVCSKEVITYKPILKEDQTLLKFILVDCGVKNGIINSLLKRGVEVTRVPWDYDFNKLSDSITDWDAVFLSNGPGDPKMCKKTIESVKVAIQNKKPIFGVCLGNQILALAAGADTYKLKYGHRSQNQPCKMEGTHRCFITSQNHGFAVNTKTLPKDWMPWFTNVNDNTNEGIRHKTLPFMSVQFHPEANPGPVDTEFLFDHFIEIVKKHIKKKTK